MTYAILPARAWLIDERSSQDRIDVAVESVDSNWSVIISELLVEELVAEACSVG